MDNDPISLEVQRLMELRQLNIWPVSFEKQGGSRVSEISDLETAFAISSVEHFLKAYWIGIAVAVLKAVAVCDTIANARDFDFVLCSEDK